MEENENNTYPYKKVDNTPKNSHSFIKSVLIPFIAGALGTILTIGICFKVPYIKNHLIEDDLEQVTSTSSSSTTSSSNLNTNLVSLSEYSDTAVGVAEKVLPSIVGIRVSYTVNSFFNTQSVATAEGSGIIISEDGYILTNNHIISSSSNSSFYEVSEANKVIVYLYNDTTEYEAKIIGSDEETDLAVIKIEKTGLTPATLGDSSSVQIGEFAMAVGNPLGMQNSISCGVVSALNREITDSDGKKYTLIQTDAAINSGNSGGALVNSKGEVIGINTMKIQGTGVEGMGFAIPINSTKDIYSQLIQYNKVKRPYIGITSLDLDEKTAEENNLPVGVYVRSVEDFSAAQKADIRNGDVITKINGIEIKTTDELNEEKNKFSIGDKITLTVVRDGQEKQIEVTLGEAP